MIPTCLIDWAGRSAGFTTADGTASTAGPDVIPLWLLVAANILAAALTACLVILSRRRRAAGRSLS